MQKLIKPTLKQLIYNNKRNLQLVSKLKAPKSQLPPNLNVFDRNTKRMQRDTSVSDPNFKDYEYVKEEVGFRVADRIFDIKRSFNSVLDLGCQRGYVSKNLTKVVKSNLKHCVFYK